ncbi:MAG: endonuclease MutS2 [Candidatus Kapabacteria bacterium]|nr:endonuclease MutS2 [Ignavibacteriota bacterium]MCW5885544.1 endonuclease MutS2 [Candidatus Kapabacteria bacterium]
MSVYHFEKPDFSEKYENKILQDSLKQLEFKAVLEFISRYSYSDLGKNYVLQSLPLENIGFLNEEHSLIDEMKNLLYRNENIPFDGLSDITHKLHKSKVENAIMSALEILTVADTIRSFRLLKSYFSEKSESSPLLSQMTSLLYENKILEKHIVDAIDDTGEVKDTATRELSRIRGEIRYKSQKLRARLEKILRKVVDENLVREDFYSVREGRFVLPVKAENKRVIPGIIHGISQTGATVFLEPSEIIEMNNELSFLNNEESREVYRILSNLTSEIGSNYFDLLRSLDIVTRFDGIYAKAKYAVNFGGIKPQITDENYIYLQNVRHPLLMHTGKEKSIIPLTIEFDGNHRGHLISGPNAGGKTVALKSIGLNILLALSGIFPLGFCRTNFRTVFASIGDHQSIEHNLSTFSSQMIQIKDILDNCDKDSLILIDEICSGTDPQEGAALACGILDTFINLNLFFIATTHQSSLKTYALNREEIVNASLEFDSIKLKPTYKFLSGIPGNSYAFALSASIGMSQLVLDRAKNYLGDKQTELETSIAVLQQYKAEAETLRNEAAQEKIKFEKLKDDYSKRISEVKSKKSEMIGTAKREAENIVRSANSLIENTIREIREEKKKISDIKNDFQIEKEKIVKSAQELSKTENAPEVEESFAAGETVIMIDNNSKGTIIVVDEEDSMALVEFGGFKFRLSLNQLKKAKADKTVKKDTADYIKYDVKTRVDVRGMRADECLKKIDDFIQEALVSNVPQVTIVHGKGTGALKQAIHDFLKYQHYARSFRLGELVEGGAGVTVVDL